MKKTPRYWRIRDLARNLTLWKALQFFAAIASILGIPIAAYVKFSKQHDYIISLSILFFLILLSWSLLIMQEFRYSRKARYAEASQDIHQSFHKLRDAWFSAMLKQGDNVFLSNLTESLRSISSAFSLITGVHCRTCIKDLICPNPDHQPLERALEVNTLCRSEDGPDPAEKSGNDYISENTDFMVLFRSPHERRFFCGNLPDLNGYKNSHWSDEIWQTRNFPYISTIVWPIRKVLKASVPGMSTYHEKQDCLGFFCVDSMARDAFWDRYDFDLGASYADMLYTVLKFKRSMPTGEGAIRA